MVEFGFVFHAANINKSLTFATMNTKKQKHGGRRKMFDPVPAVKKTIYVPANDVQLSMAVAKAAVQRRFEKLSAGKVMKKEAGDDRPSEH